MIRRVSTPARRDTYGRRIDRTHSPALANALPWASILLTSLLPQLPIATAAPLMPPLGLMMLLCWRLVRPGLLPVWAGFPLGMWDDLFSGQPFGSAILLWSVAMIAIEILEARVPWRTFYADWGVSSLFISIYLFGAAMFSGAGATPQMLAGLVPQAFLAVLLMPFVSRFVAWLDRLRLTRFRSI